MDEKFYNRLRDNYNLLDEEACYYQIKTLISAIKENNTLNDNLYKHPLGFCYSILHQFDNQDSFRLHIWTEDIKVNQSPLFIHNHYYTVTSFVIIGQITNITFNVSPSNTEATHTKYVGSYKNQNERILQRSSKNYKINKSKKQKIDSNNLYQIFKPEFHTATVLKDKINCTLVLTSESEEPNPLVFGDIKGENEYIFKSKLISKQNTEIIKKKLCLTPYIING